MHSAVEVFKENSFISGVCTKTASSFVPRVNIEQSRAGYLKMVGWLKKSQGDNDCFRMLMMMFMLKMLKYLTKAQVMAKEVPTPSTVSRRRERMLT